ncbi:MAG: class I SAM-dependent methyltransferase [Acidimicrobiales bacterium]
MTGSADAPERAISCVVEPEIDLVAPAFRHDGIDVYVCPSCGTLVSDAAYDPEQYDESYYTIASDDLDAIEQRWGFRWRYVLDGIADRCPAGASILDVGAGNGLFTKLAVEEYGFVATGLEVSEESARFADSVLGVELLVGDVADHDGTYDVVTAFSVIEHVADPAGMLSQLTARLRPGGLLVVATPNPGCIQRRVKGIRRWGMVCPPHHLNIFTSRGLERLLARAGFTVVHRETISTSVKAVEPIDTSGQLLRRAVFRGLRAMGLGADQLVFSTR